MVKIVRRTYRTAILALLLCIAGLSIAAHRNVNHQVPITPPKKNNSWTIEARMFFKAKDEPAKVRFFLPKDNKNFTIVDEQFITQNYTTSIALDKKTNNRTAIFENKLASGQQVLLYRMTVELEKAKDKKSLDTDQANENNLPDDKQLWLASKKDRPEISSISYTKLNRAVLNLITLARENSGNNRDMLRYAINIIKDRENELTKDIYAQLQPQTSSYSLLQYLLYQAQIPFTKTHGFTINKDNKSFPFREWIDVYLDKQWVQIDAAGELKNNEPPEQFRWWIGDEPIIDVEGATHADIDIYYKENLQSQTAKNLEKGTAGNLDWIQYPFADLPISTQRALEVLLLMPIGALIISLFRQVVGIPTYGTFMPILLAVAFRDISPTWSLIMFASIITLGLLARWMIENLQLLMVPKLSAIMTMMIAAIIGFSLFSHEIDLRASFSIGLLPIVILAMLIERITVNWDEYGYKQTIITAIGSLFLTYICYLVLNQDSVSHIIFNFPELLLVILALIMLVGRYRGYKLTEIFRFKYFLKDEV